MLIVEELFLLLLRDDGKPESAFAQNNYGLAAAVMTDLIVAQRIQLSDNKDPRVSVVSDGEVGNPILDAALARLRERDGKKLSSLVTDRKLSLEQLVAESLAAAGVVRIEEKRALGLVPARYPMMDSVPEAQLRQRLGAVISGASASVADAALLSILQGIDLAATVLKDEKGELNKRELKSRIEMISTDIETGRAAADAVAKAVQTMSMVMMTTVIVPIATSSGN